MAADFLSKWVRPDTTVFGLNGVFALDRDGVKDSGIDRRIPSADGFGDGELSIDSLTSPRIVTISGTIIAADGLAATVRTHLDTLTAAFQDRGIGKLYIHSDRFLECRLQSFDPDPENSLPYRTWKATFKASGVPFWQSDEEYIFSTAGAALNVNPLGSAPTPGRLEIEVTATGAPAGTISIEHEYGIATIRPSDTGVYLIDGKAGTVTRDGDDAIADFEGVFPRFIPALQTLNISALSGAAYDIVAAYARSCSENL